MSDRILLVAIVADLLWFVGRSLYGRFCDHIAEEFAFALNYPWEPWYHWRDR